MRTTARTTRADPSASVVPRHIGVVVAAALGCGKCDLRGYLHVWHVGMYPWNERLDAQRSGDVVFISTGLARAEATQMEGRRRFASGSLLKNPATGVSATPLHALGPEKDEWFSAEACCRRRVLLALAFHGLTQAIQGGGGLVGRKI